MLTRIEIDGFKTFEGFALDLMPFSVITGPNASGKSNLFDAFRLLARVVAAPDLGQAFQGLRGQPAEQFREYPGAEPCRRVILAAECLTEPVVADAFGNVVELKQTRTRYELQIERRTDPATNIERLFVVSESARPIRKTDDNWARIVQERFPALATRIRHARHINDYLRTLPGGEDGPARIEARQDGVQGRPRPLPADRATATYLSTVNDAKDFRHLFALRRSLADVMFLQADPAAERRPSSFGAPDGLTANADNLAFVLYRIRQATATAERPEGALADISMDIASLIPGIHRIDVRVNETARQFELDARLRDGQSFSSRILSDGTLRLLALVTVVNDPNRAGVLCFEEPENGVSEGRIAPLIDLLRGVSTNPDGRLFQVVMNSHSPAVLRCLEPHEHIAADLQTVLAAGQQPPRRRTRMRPGIATTLFPLDPERTVTRAEWEEMLRDRAGQNA